MGAQGWAFSTLRGGDPPLQTNDAAEASFVSSWNKEIGRSARRVAGFSGRAGSDDHEDVAQDIRVRLLEAYRTFQGPPPDRYIRRSFKNTAVNSIRKDQHRITLHHTDVVSSIYDQTTSESTDPGVQAEEEDLYAESAVRNFLRTLPDILQGLYEMLYVRDCKQCDIARELKLTPARVSQLHHELLERGAHDLAHLAR